MRRMNSLLNTVASQMPHFSRTNAKSNLTKDLLPRQSILIPFSARIRISIQMVCLVFNFTRLNHDRDTKRNKYFFHNLGHSCVISSKNINTPQLSKLDAYVILKVTWGRYHSTTVNIPFKPAIFLDTIKLIISDEKTTDYIRFVGLPSVLSNVQVRKSMRMLYEL